MAKRKKQNALLEQQTSKYAAYRQDDKSINKEKPKNFLKTGLRLLSMLKGSGAAMFFVIIFCIAGSFLSATGPTYLGGIIDLIKEQVDNKLATGSMEFEGIIRILLTVVAVYAASSVCGFADHFIMAGTTQRLITDLREKINRKLSVLPLSFFDGHNKGDLLSRVTNDIDNINNTFQNNIIDLTNSVVTFFGVLGIMLYNNRLMTAVSLSPLPFGAIAALIILNSSKKYFRRHWEVMGDVNGHIEEMITGHSIVRAFGHEKKAIEEFRLINDNLSRVGFRAQFLSGILPPVMNLANNVGYVLICLIGGKLILDGKATIGQITVFVTYSKLFMQPLVDTAKIINQIQSSLASAERVFDIVDAKEQIPDTPKTELTDPSGEVELKDVSFSYDSTLPLIGNMNLHVAPGSLTAIVGPTGAGKTTIVNLLMRFYEVDSGGIYLDGTNITDISRENLHNIFGMVLQDTWLFAGTIRENLMYGHPDRSEEEFKAACDAARVSDFVETLPDGYDTVLDENGSNLSQGQKQLLTIARALLSDPKILILDEATSSVDTRTERKIQEAMENLMRGRTNFVIAHRLSTIRHADCIIFIKDGRITEKGTHEELLAKKGDYAELYLSQFSV